jgi:hypothetical protein
MVSLNIEEVEMVSLYVWKHGRIEGISRME